MTGRVFGEIPGFQVGSEFQDREALHQAGVHRPLQAGISGAADEGADSIVVAGGYEDDEDFGDVIVYTGHGGNNPGTGRQVADQELVRGNLALAKSCLDGLPVRVIRGAGGDPRFSPAQGYRYDGLYYVESYWSWVGRAGYRIWRFRLVEEPESTPAYQQSSEEAGSHRGFKAEVQRVVWNTPAAQRVKQLNDYTCQICGAQIHTPAGPYAEAAHIRPLGSPHNGSDDMGNLLCLCPSDHVLLAHGGLRILDDLKVTDADGTIRGRLTVRPQHEIQGSNLSYHRALFERG